MALVLSQVSFRVSVVDGLSLMEMGATRCLLARLLYFIRGMYLPEDTYSETFQQHQCVTPRGQCKRATSTCISNCVNSRVWSTYILFAVVVARKGAANIGYKAYHLSVSADERSSRNRSGTRRTRQMDVLARVTCASKVPLCSCSYRMSWLMRLYMGVWQVFICSVMDQRECGDGCADSSKTCALGSSIEIDRFLFQDRCNGRHKMYRWSLAAVLCLTCSSWKLD